MRRLFKTDKPADGVIADKPVHLQVSIEVLPDGKLLHHLEMPHKVEIFSAAERDHPGGALSPAENQYSRLIRSLPY